MKIYEATSGKTLITQNNKWDDIKEQLVKQLGVKVEGDVLRLTEDGKSAFQEQNCKEELVFLFVKGVPSFVILQHIPQLKDFKIVNNLDQVELAKQLDYFMKESQFLEEAYNTAQKRLEQCSSCMKDQQLRVKSLNAFRAYLSESLRKLKESMDLFSESLSSNCKILSEIDISNLIFELKSTPLDTNIKTKTRTTLFDCIENKDVESQFSRTKELLCRLDQTKQQFEQQYNVLIQFKEDLPENPHLTSMDELEGMNHIAAKQSEVVQKHKELMEKLDSALNTTLSASNSWTDIKSENNALLFAKSLRELNAAAKMKQFDTELQLFEDKIRTVQILFEAEFITLYNSLTNLLKETKTFAKRLSLYINIEKSTKHSVSQIKTTTKVQEAYKFTLAEIVRRKQFKKELEKQIYLTNENIRQKIEEENRRRKEFESRIEGILPRDLIPGLFAIVPDCSINIPLFDSTLPPIKAENIEDCQWLICELTKSMLKDQKKPKVSDKKTDQVGEKIGQEIDTDDEELSKSEDEISDTEILECLRHKERVLQQKEEEIKKLKVSLSLTRSGIFSKDMSDIGNQKALIADVSNLKKRLEDANKNVATLQQENSYLKSSIVKQQDELAKIDMVRKKLEADTLELKKQFQEEKAILSKQLEEALTEKAKLEEQFKTVLAKKEEIRQSERASLVTRIETLTKDVNESRKELSDAKQILNAEISELKSELEKKTEDLKVSKAEISKLLASLQSAEKVQKDFESKVTTITNENEEIKSRLAAVTEQLEATKAQYENTLKSKELEIQNLKSVNEKYKTFIENTVNLVLTKDEEIRKLSAEESGKTIKQLEEQLKIQTSLNTATLQKLETTTKHLQMALDKIVSLNKSLEKAKVKPNEIKIAVCDFKVNDLVIFQPDSNGNWEIFNRDCPGYFLAAEVVAELRKMKNYNQVSYILAQILFMEEQVAQKNNPYGFAPGVKFHAVHVYPIDKE